jgi:hypothetical protein
MAAMKTLLTLLVLTLSITTNAALPTSAKAKIYDLDKKAVLYTYDHKAQVEGDQVTINNTFQTPDGKVVATEKTIMKNDRLVSYEIEQKQINAAGKIEVQGDKLNFTYTKDGKTKSDSEKTKDNVVVGPTLISYMHGKWKELMDGKDVDIRFAVADRRETVGFTLKKVETKDYSGQKAVVIRMKPTSFLIAAIVNPLHFTMNLDGDHLFEMRGRVIPKMQVPGGFKELDGVTVYEF